MSSVTALQTADAALGAAPRAMPAWIYDHPQLTKLEIDRILKPSWQIVCHVNSIPKPGDYVTLDLGPESVVALRDREGTIRGFHNVCRHRGARCSTAPATAAGPITCPYHGWSYKQDGSLQGVPRARPSRPRSPRNRLDSRCASISRFGFVFVVPERRSAAGAGSIGAVLEDFAPYRFEEMVPAGPITTRIGPATGRSPSTTTSSPTTCPSGIPGLQRMFTPDYDDQPRLPGCGARHQLAARAAIQSRWSERMYQRMVVPLTDASARDAPPQLALLQSAAEPGHRCVPGSDGFLPGAAQESGSHADPQWRVWTAGRAPRNARTALVWALRINNEVNSAG